RMITGGSWELDLYKKLPIKYENSDVILKFFIVHNNENYNCDIVEKDGIFFIFIHSGDGLKVPNYDEDLIYTLNSSTPSLNVVESIFEPTGIAQKRILWFFKTNRVYYENNAIGDSINNYLKECRNV